MNDMQKQTSHGSNRHKNVSNQNNPNVQIPPPSDVQMGGMNGNVNGNGYGNNPNNQNYGNGNGNGNSVSISASSSSSLKQNSHHFREGDDAMTQHGVYGNIRVHIVKLKGKLVDVTYPVDQPPSNRKKETIYLASLRVL